MNDEVAKRVAFNCKENVRYFTAIQSGLAIEERTLFLMTLLDGMFSVIEADDFKKLCIKAVATLGGRPQ